MPDWTDPELAHERLRILHDYRWPAGFRCHCGRADARLAGGDHYVAYNCVCGRQSDLTDGTKLDPAHLSLETWWQAARLFGELGTSLTVRDLKDRLALTQKAAWKVADTLHQARKAVLDRRIEGAVGIEVLYVPWQSRQRPIAALKPFSIDPQPWRYIAMDAADAKSVESIAQRYIQDHSSIGFGRYAVYALRRGHHHFGPDPRYWPGTDFIGWAAKLMKYLTPRLGRQRSFQDRLDDAAFAELAPIDARGPFFLRALIHPPKSTHP